MARFKVTTPQKVAPSLPEQSSFSCVSPCWLSPSSKCILSFIILEENKLNKVHFQAVLQEMCSVGNECLENITSNNILQWKKKKSFLDMCRMIYHKMNQCDTLFISAFLFSHFYLLLPFDFTVWLTVCDWDTISLRVTPQAMFCWFGLLAKNISLHFFFHGTTHRAAKTSGC